MSSVMQDPAREAMQNAIRLDRLHQCEAVIERGLRSFAEAGAALADIRQQRLYRGSFKSFARYCRERWHFSRRRADQLIRAAAVVARIIEASKPKSENRGSHSPAPLPVPPDERTARELAKVPEAQQVPIYREAVEQKGGKAPTAADVRRVVAGSNDDGIIGLMREAAEKLGGSQAPQKPQPFSLPTATKALFAAIVSQTNSWPDSELPAAAATLREIAAAFDRGQRLR